MTGKRYLYTREGGEGRLEIETIIDGDLLTIIPTREGLVLNEGIRKVALSPSMGVDELIRESTGSLLQGYALDEIREDTTEIEATVIHEMKKTPISLRDGVYEKRFLETLILCLDLRSFSSYARDQGRDEVKGFLERYTQELLAAINAYAVSYYKLLGDGALILWDNPSRGDVDNAVELFTLLRWVIGETGPAFGYRDSLAGALLVDEVYKYEIYAESSGLKYRDYVGYGINFAFRLQGAARSKELLSTRDLVERFGLAASQLPEGARPTSESMKGIRERDYEDIQILVAPD